MSVLILSDRPLIFHIFALWAAARIPFWEPPGNRERQRRPFEYTEVAESAASMQRHVLA